MILNDVTKKVLESPRYLTLIELWKRRQFLPFATTKLGTNFRQIEAFKSLFDDAIDELLFGGGARGGKAQPLDAIVYTPFGKRRMGDLKVGSVICHPSGCNTNVIAIHPQGVKKIYEIEFSDGAKTRTCGDHLWQCWFSSKKSKQEAKSGTKGKIQTTEMLIGKLHKNPIIPLCSPINFTLPIGKSKPKILSPYILGALIGDGGLTKSLSLSSADDFIVQEIGRELPDFLKIQSIPSALYGFSITQNERNEKGVRINIGYEEIKKYGLNCKSECKFIPTEYHHASLADRMSIIQGLMDTDGTVDDRGHCSYSTSSEQLGLDFQYIVRSLGYKATIRVKKTTHLDSYCVYIQGKNCENLFRLPRKKNLCKPYLGGLADCGRLMVSIKEVGEVECQCITVDNIDGLYITDDFIVTHNSFLGCTWIVFNALTMPKSSWLIIRKDLTRIKDTTVPTMLKVLDLFGIPSSEYEMIGANSGATIHFKNGSKVYFRGGGYDPNDRDFNRFGSYDLTGVFLEECQELTYKLVNILRGRFSVLEGDGWKTKPKILMTCNPAKTWIYTLFYDAQRKGTILSYRKFIKALVTDNPNVSEDYILSLQKSDEITKQRLLYGNFDYDDDATALTTFETCQAIFTNDYVKTDVYNKKMIIDPALGGKDGCGINVFYGLSCMERITFDKLTPLQFVSEVKKVQARHDIMNHKMVFDAVGVGALSSANFPNAVMFTANAAVIWKPDPAKRGTDRDKEDKPPFDNLKSQCGFRLSEYINEGKIVYKCRVSEEDKQSIIEQLGQLKRKDLIEDKRIGLISKDEIKANIGYSPTDLDMLQMLMYFEIKEQYEPRRKPLKSYAVDL